VPTLDLQPGNVKIDWTLGAVLHTVHGTFRLKRGSVDFDPRSGKASGEVVVDVRSGQTGDREIDRKMHAEVLQSNRFPDAMFVPDRVEGAFSLTGNSRVKVHGLLTIHGAGHEMTLDVQTDWRGDQISASTEFDIPYVAWKMKDPSNFLLRVSKTVHLSILASGSASGGFR
jgi:polyisoprenoid-binding protein YceI